MTKKTIIFVVAAIMAVSSFATDFDYQGYLTEFNALRAAKDYAGAKKLYSKTASAAPDNIKQGHAYYILFEQMVLRIKHLGENQQDVLSWVNAEAVRLGITEAQKLGLNFFGTYHFSGWKGAIEYAETLTENQRRGSGTAIWMSHAYAATGTTADHFTRAIEYAIIGDQPFQAYQAARKLKNKRVAVDTVNRIMDLGLIRVGNAKQALYWVQLLTENVSDADAPAVKSCLLRANRNWSMFLLKDAEAWKPVITLIRTALEAY